MDQKNTDMTRRRAFIVYPFVRLYRGGVDEHTREKRERENGTTYARKREGNTAAYCELQSKQKGALRSVYTSARFKKISKHRCLPVCLLPAVSDFQNVCTSASRARIEIKHEGLALGASILYVRNFLFFSVLISALYEKGNKWRDEEAKRAKMLIIGRWKV